MAFKTEKAFLNWSGGKDAAFSVYQYQQKGTFPICYLLTTLSAKQRRISMHGVRESLLNQQASAINIPLKKIYLPENAPMETYNRAMRSQLNAFAEEGIHYAIFGDIFLEDLRQYREEQLLSAGMTGLFPLWKKNTTEIITEFLDAGFKAIITAVNAKLLDRSFAGRILNEEFLHDLPEGIDPCGENGEFHSFVFDGPIFQRPVLFSKGSIWEKEYKSSSEDEYQWDSKFFFCDLIP